MVRKGVVALEEMAQGQERECNSAARLSSARIRHIRVPRGSSLTGRRYVLVTPELSPPREAES
jgi:hypothetical protein